MIWVVLALTAAVFLAIGNILEKAVLKHEIKDTWLATALLGAVAGIVFLVVPWFFGFSLDIVPWKEAIMGFSVGLFNMVGRIFYYKSMKKEDVSRVVPLLAIHPLVVLGLAFFILGERLSIFQYVGIFSIVAGVIVLSKGSKKRKVAVLGIVFALLAAAFYALKDFITKSATMDISALALLFWVGLGFLVSTLIIGAFRGFHIKKKAYQGVKHFVLIDLLVVGSLLLIILALEAGPASPVAAFLQFRPLFVFFMALFLSKKYPEFLQERKGKRMFLKKAIGTLLMIGGGVSIILG